MSNLTIMLRLKKATYSTGCTLCGRTIKEGEWHRYRNTSETHMRHSHINCIPGSQSQMQSEIWGSSVLFPVLRKSIPVIAQVSDLEKQLLHELFERHGEECQRWFDDYTCETCELMKKLFPELYDHFTEVIEKAHQDVWDDLEVSRMEDDRV